MIRSYASLTVLLVTVLFSELLSAAAYPGSLSSQFVGFAPEQPRAGVNWYANLLAGPCEYLSPDPAAATLLSHVNGVVSIRIPGAIDISCNQDIAPRQFQLPALPAGDYRVDLTLYMVEFPGDHGTPVGYIGGRDVQVLPAPTTMTIPTLGTQAAAILATLALAGGALMTRRRAGGPS